MKKSLVNSLMVAFLTVVSFAQAEQTVMSSDGTAMVLLPDGWQVTQEAQGYLAIQGPNGTGQFGVGATYWTPEYVAQMGIPAESAPYHTPEQVITSLVPQLAAQSGSRIDDVRILDEQDESNGPVQGRWMIVGAVSDGVRMIFLARVASYPLTDVSWGFSLSLMGVRSQDFARDAHGIARVMTSFRGMETARQNGPAVSPSAMLERIKATGRGNDAFSDYLRNGGEGDAGGENGGTGDANGAGDGNAAPEDNGAATPNDGNGDGR